jgi:glucokinase
MSYVIGMDLGGSSIKAVAVTPEGETLASVSEPFEDRDMQWAARMREIVVRMQAERGAPAQAIGVSAPGLAARDARSIAVMPGRLHGLVGLDWADYLGASQPVPVLNDAHAALLGEVWLGAARGMEDVMMFTLGTGVGGAAMVDGHLLRGHIGRAGHLGHLAIDMNGPVDDFNTPGSLEHFMGNKFIRQRTDGRFPTTHALVEAAQAGDAGAKEIWLRSVRALACAIGSLVNVLDPEAAIIGGGIARAGEFLFGPLREMVPQFEWQAGGHAVKLLPAQLGDLAGAYGSAANALGWHPSQTSA